MTGPERNLAGQRIITLIAERFLAEPGNTLSEDVARKQAEVLLEANNRCAVVDAATRAMEEPLPDFPDGEDARVVAVTVRNMVTRAVMSEEGKRS